MKAVSHRLSVFLLLICCSYSAIADGTGPIFGQEWVPEGTKMPKTWGLSITTMTMEQSSKLSGVEFRGRAGDYIKDLQ